jgi:RND superfamily putative drug exporter
MNSSQIAPINSHKRIPLNQRGRHTVVIAAWLLACVVLFPLAGRVTGVLDVNARIENSESALVEELLATEMGSVFARSLLLVVGGKVDPAVPAGREALQNVVTAIESIPEVGGTLSYLDAPDDNLLGMHGHGAIVIVGIAAGVAPDVAIPALRSILAPLRVSLEADYPDSTLLLTGQSVLNFDLRTASAEESRAGELRVFPLVLVLLLLGFGSIVAAFLPVVAGAIAIPLALGLAVIVSTALPLSALLLNVVSMIGLGLGIDYSLLTVSRWRDSKARGLSGASYASTRRQVARTIALSGVAVAVGFAALLVVPLNELRSVAVGGLLAVLVSVLLATSLLPTLLELLGPRIDSGRIPTGQWLSLLVSRVSRGRFQFAGTQFSAFTSNMWERWARWVVRRPLAVLVVALPPLLLLSIQAVRLDTGLPQGDWLPASMESTRALEKLKLMGRDGLVQTIRVLIELPAGESVLTPMGRVAGANLSTSLLNKPQIAYLRGLPVMLPEGVPASAVSANHRYLLVDLVPQAGSDPEVLNDLVSEIRETGVGELTGLPGMRMWVGGLSAFNVDYNNAVSGRFILVVGLVVAATLLVLMFSFRSLLIPIKAVLLNLLSVTSAFGALVLVFQDGYGATLLGLQDVPGSVFPIIPVLVFCVVFGLSMDYEVFLVSRIAESRRRLGEAAAITEGLSQTGHVITSAAAIMIVVFGGFTLGDFVLVKMLGFALATAVFVDAAIIRVAISPALLVLLGRWNWWPGKPGAGPPPAAIAPVRAAPGEDIVSFVSVRALSHGGKMALSLRASDSSEDLTYAELHRLVVAFASSLIEQGVRPGERVALVAEARPRWAAALLGILRAGCIAVPLDSQLKAAELAPIVADARPGILISSAKCAGLARQLAGGLVPQCRCLSLESLAPIHSYPRVPRGDDDIAVISYTSGTTGRPKGVMTTFGNLLFQVRDFRQVMHNDESTVGLSILPPHHLFELTVGLLGVLFGGGSVCYCQSLFPQDVTAAIREERITCIATVPLFLKLLKQGIEGEVRSRPVVLRCAFHLLFSIAHLLPWSVRRVLFRSVHQCLGSQFAYFICGGARLDPKISRFFERLGLGVCQGYGMAETSPVISANSPLVRRYRSVGKPMPGVEIRIAATRAEEPGGEILTRGPHVMKGYYRREDLTRQLIDAEGWLHTGDLGYLDDDGFLYVTGRLKNLIVLGSGKKIQPEEIEPVLFANSLIAEGCVVGHMSGSGLLGDTEQLCAVVVASDVGGQANTRDSAKLVEQVRDAVRDNARQLAGFKRPTRVLVRFEELPKTATRKIRRNMVRAWVNEQVSQ